MSFTAISSMRRISRAKNLTEVGAKLENQNPILGTLHNLLAIRGMAYRSMQVSPIQ